MPAKASWISKKSMSSRREAVAGQQPRHGEGGGHQQAVLAVDKVDGGRLAVDHRGELGQVVGVGPFLGGEQHGGGAVGQRGGVAGRHGGRGAQVLAEDGLERGQLLEAGVGAQVGVPGQAAVRGEQVIEEAGVVGGGEVAVAVEGQLVLGLAGDLPLGRGERLVLAHGQAGARLARVRGIRGEVLGPEPAEDLEPLRQRLGAVEVQEHLAQALADGDGGVRGGVHAAGDGRVDLAELDLVGQAEDGFQPGGAGLLQVVGRGLGGQRGAQHGFAGEVEVPGVLEHGAGGDFADALVLQPEPGDQPVQGGGQHVLVGGLGVGAAGPGEGNAVAAHDHRLAELRRRCCRRAGLPRRRLRAVSLGVRVRTVR